MSLCGSSDGSKLIAGFSVKTQRIFNAHDSSYNSKTIYFHPSGKRFNSRTAVASSFGLPLTSKSGPRVELFIARNMKPFDWHPAVVTRFTIKSDKVEVRFDDDGSCRKLELSPNSVKRAEDALEFHSGAVRWRNVDSRVLLKRCTDLESRNAELEAKLQTNLNQLASQAQHERLLAAEARCKELESEARLREKRQQRLESPSALVSMLCALSKETQITVIRDVARHVPAWAKQELQRLHVELVEEKRRGAISSVSRVFVHEATKLTGVDVWNGAMVRNAKDEVAGYANIESKVHEAAKRISSDTEIRRCRYYAETLLRRLGELSSSRVSTDFAPSRVVVSAKSYAQGCLQKDVLPSAMNVDPQRGDAKLRALQSRRREYEERRLAESAALEPPSAEKRPHPYDFDEPAESTPPPLHMKPRSAALGVEPAAPRGEKRPRDEDDPAEIDRDAKKQHGQSTPASVAHVGQVSAIPGSFWI